MLKRSDEWYAQRIRRRAVKKNVFSRPGECFDFSDLDADAQTEIVNTIPVDINPVLVFGSLEHRWTVLGTRGIYSAFDGSCRLVEFGSPKGSPKSAVPVGREGQPTKREAEWLVYGSETIWAPPGATFYALWGFLNSIESSYPQPE